MERRAALGLLAGTAALLAGTGASQAAYGDAARVFAGKITNKSGFVPYAGEGFALLLPAKWNPSPERDFPGTVLRCNEGVCNEGVGVGRFGAGFQRFGFCCAQQAPVHHLRGYIRSLRCLHVTSIHCRAMHALHAKRIAVTVSDSTWSCVNLQSSDFLASDAQV